MTAYLLFDNVKVTDPAGLARYTELVARTVTDHGGRYLSVSAEPEVLEGRPGLTEPVLIEFANPAAARAWYHSPEYQPLKKLRRRSAGNTAVLIPGPSPDE